MFKNIIKRYIAENKHMYYISFIDLLTTGVFTINDIKDNIELFNIYNDRLGFIVKGILHSDTPPLSVLYVTTIIDTMGILSNENAIDEYSLLGCGCNFYFHGIIKLKLLSGLQIYNVLKDVIEIKPMTDMNIL